MAKEKVTFNIGSEELAHFRQRAEVYFVKLEMKVNYSVYLEKILKKDRHDSDNCSADSKN